MRAVLKKTLFYFHAAKVREEVKGLSVNGYSRSASIFEKG
jgi:hypothetical protein